MSFIQGSSSQGSGAVRGGQRYSSLESAGQLSGGMESWTHVETTPIARGWELISRDRDLMDWGMILSPLGLS